MLIKTKANFKKGKKKPILSEVRDLGVASYLTWPFGLIQKLG